MRCSTALLKSLPLFACCLLSCCFALANTNINITEFATNDTHYAEKSTDTGYCSKTSKSLNDAVYTKNQNIYLTRGGAHQAVDDISAVVRAAIEQQHDYACLQLPLSDRGKNRETQNRIFSALKTLLTAISTPNQPITTQVHVDVHINDSKLNTPPLSSLEYVLKTSSSQFSVRDAGLLFGVSFVDEGRDLLLVINVDPYSKHTLPLHFIVQEKLIDARNKDLISTQNNPVLQPAEFFLFERKTLISDQGTEPSL